MASANLSWIFGAALAPLAALGLSLSFGLIYESVT